MKITTLLSILLIQLLGIVFAETVTFTQQGGSTNLNVNNGSTFDVELKGNPTTGYSWYLENVDKVNGSGVEPLNLDENNSGEYVQKQSNVALMGAGGTFSFKFIVNDINDLPTLSFVYMRSWEKEAVATAEVILESSESATAELPVVSVDDADMEVEFSQQGGVQDLKVEKDTTFNVKIQGNPTTGYSWYLDNVDEVNGSGVEPLNLDETNSGDYIQDNAQSGMDGVGGTFVFKFQVKEVDDLPTLKFVYKRPWEKSAIATAEVNLESSESATVETPVVSADIEVEFSREGGDQELEVKNDTTFDVKIQGNPTTGYSWYLENVDEVNSSGVEPLNLDENNSGDYMQKQSNVPLMGAGGTFSFKFKVKDVNNLPTLSFVYMRSWEKEAVATAKLTLKSSETASDPSTVETPTVSVDEADMEVEFSREGGDQELEVQNDTTFDVKIQGNPTTGYSWYLENVDEVNGSGVEPLNLNEYNSGDYMQKQSDVPLMGAGGTFIFKFKVKDVNNLPTLSFVYMRSWEKEAVATAKLTLKSSETTSDPSTVETPVVETPVVSVDEADMEVEFSREGGDQELEVENDTTFDVKIQGNPTTGYSWYLENVDEVNGSGVEPLNLDENNSGDYMQKQSDVPLMGAGGTFIFKFKVKDVNNLPTLSFVYMRSWVKEAVATAKLTLKNKDSVSVVETPVVETPVVETPVVETPVVETPVIETPVVETPVVETPVVETPVVETPVVDVSFTQEGGKKEFAVFGNSTFAIGLEGNPTTGYVWLLDNAEEIAKMNTVEALNLNESNGTDNYVSKSNPYGFTGVGGTFIFTFKVKEFCPERLPALKFAYRRPWESGKADVVAEVTLQSKDEDCASSPVVPPTPKPIVNEVLFQQNDTRGEIKVKANSTFTIKIKGNPSTGYSWSLTNQKELTKAGITTVVNGKYTRTSKLIGSGGIYEFQFKVGALAKKLPSIKFTYKRSWTKVGKQLTVAIKPAK